MSSIYNITKKYLDDRRFYNKKEMILTDFLFLLVTGLVSLYPVSRLVKYRDRKKEKD